jgi:uncharacterized protein (TIGR03437 family)
MRNLQTRLAGAALGFLLVLTAYGQAPSGLTVKAATSKRVDLSWTGTASGYTLQRRTLGGTFSTLATVASNSYSDTTIDSYTTYQYQVAANLASGTSAASNQVTVGPPPSGFTTAAPAPGPPDSYIAGNFAYDMSVTMDGNGDPAMVFVFYDPNADTDPSDTRVEFRSWNRALYKWNDIVHVALNVGDIASAFRNTTSLAYDTSTGVFAVATEIEGCGAAIYLSTDSGATWTKKATFKYSGDVFSPSLALANGNLYLAYVVDFDGLKYVTGKLSADPATWQTKSAPAKTNNADRAAPSTTISLALDSTGTAGVAWWSGQLTGSGEILQFWKPDTGTPIKVMDSQGNSSDVSVKLVFDKLNPRVLVYVARNDADTNVHSAKSDNGGATWATPVVIPPDIGSSTDFPFDLAVDSQGRGAAVVGRNSGNGSDVCGNPKVSRTNDFVTFKTCDVVNDVTVTGNYTVIPASVQIRFGGNDKLYLLWWDTGGIIMYREPPAGTTTAPNISTVVNGATFQPGIVAGSWTTITGVNLADVTRTWQDSDFNGNILPTNLSGVSVKINGLDAPVYFVSATQINVQAPSNLSGNVPVQLTHNGVVSNTITANALSTAPGLFTYSLGGKSFPSALYNGTYTIVGDPALYSSAAKAKAGDIVQLYGTGLGSSPAGNIIQSVLPFSSPVTVTIGSTNVTASFAGLVGVGLFQINFTVPSLADGEYPLSIKVGSASSQTGVILQVTH